MKQTPRLALRRETLTPLEPADLGLVAAGEPQWAPTREPGLCDTYTITRRSVCICDA